MRATWSMLAVLVGVGCQCQGPSISSRYGELVFVGTDETGLEVLSAQGHQVFPATSMGTTATLAVPVRNVGVETVGIVSITRTSGSEALTLTAERPSVAGQTDDTVTLTFTPPQADDPTLETVPHAATFELTLEGTAEDAATITLSVTAVASARDCYVPAVIDFGRVPVRTAVDKPISVLNGTPLAQTLEVGGVGGVDSQAFTTQAERSTVQVAPNSAGTFNLRFAPLEARRHEARLSLKRDTQCPAADVLLLGSGDDAALTWQPTMLDFGRLPVGERSEKEVMITNGSTAALSLSASVSNAAFTIVNPPPEVPASSVARVKVACSPLALGTQTDQLVLSIGTVPATSARINLICRGGGPRIRVEPPVLSFGQVPLNLPVKRRLVVQNVGSPPDPLDPHGYDLLLGRDGGVPWFGVVPLHEDTRPTDFSVSLAKGTPERGLPAVIGQNSAEFEVTITHGGGSTKLAELLVYSNDSKEPVVRVPMSGAGLMPTPCNVEIQPTSANFGSAPRGASLQRTITIKNLDSTPGSVCLVSGIGIAPGSHPAYSVRQPVESSLLIPSGQSRDIVVAAVTPGDVEIGTYLRGQLRFRLSDEPTEHTIPLDLLIGRCLIIDPLSLDLGLTQTNCSSEPRAVNIYNACGTALTVESISVSGSPFVLSENPTQNGGITLPAGGRITVKVANRPLSEGTANGRLEVVSIEGGARYLEASALSASASVSGQQADRFKQVVRDVDILLVVDNSGSMADEQQALSSNFMSFISAATMSTGQWQIAVVTTDLGELGVMRRNSTNPAVLTPNLPGVQQLFADKVRVGINGSGLEQPIDAMASALSEPNLSGLNAGFVRPNAALAVVMVTDALDSSTTSPAAALSIVRRLKPNASLVSVSVVGPFEPYSSSCFTEGRVDDGRFHELTSATGGVEASICTSNWAGSLSAISSAVFGSRRAFELSSVPRERSNAGLRVTVNGSVVTNWTYDAFINSVVFTTPPPKDANIVVEYLTVCR